MMLYDEDFNIINDEDKSLWEELKEQERVIIDGKRSNLITKSLYREYPKSIRHNLSLFPNNFLDTVDLIKENAALRIKLENFKAILDDNQSQERELLNYIKDNKAHFLIGSILKNNYSFGHHSSFVFPEFACPPNFRVDYLIVGQNSDGYHFVFVEFENPYGQITVKDGSYGETVRKGIRQIEDWELWLEQNFAHLRLVFEQSLGINKQLPKEFTVFDKTRIHFVVISGRRVDYQDKTYRLRRSNCEQRKLNVFHYDNLIDFANETIGTNTY